MIKNLTSEIVLQNKYSSFYALVNGPESKKKKKKKKKKAKQKQRNRSNNYHASVMKEQLTTEQKYKKYDTHPTPPIQTLA